MAEVKCSSRLAVLNVAVIFWDIRQFWAKLNVGNAKLQKVSSKTSVTNWSDMYSLVGGRPAHQRTQGKISNC